MWDISKGDIDILHAANLVPLKDLGSIAYLGTIE